MAASIDEVPVGAVVVRQGQIISSAHNLKESTNDPTAHAEIVAMRSAANLLGDWRLTDCDLYTTLEPCPMCAGAALHFRIRKLVFGALDLKWGAVVSKFQLLVPGQVNHTIKWEYYPVSDCETVLRQFFAAKRMKL